MCVCMLESCVYANLLSHILWNKWVCVCVYLYLILLCCSEYNFTVAQPIFKWLNKTCFIANFCSQITPVQTSNGILEVLATIIRTLGISPLPSLFFFQFTIHLVFCSPLFCYLLCYWLIVSANLEMRKCKFHGTTFQMGWKKQISNNICVNECVTANKKLSRIRMKKRIDNMQI